MSDPNQTTGIPWDKWRAELAALVPPGPRPLDPKSFDDVDEWEKKLRAKTFELLTEPPRSDKVEVEVLAEVACDGYTRREVEYTTTGDIRTRAWVLVPEGADQPARQGTPPKRLRPSRGGGRRFGRRRAKKPLPGIVALHDCGGLVLFGRAKITEIPDPPPVLKGHWDRCYGGRPFAQELARRGYVVIVTDMLGYGDRRLHDARTVALEGSGKPFDEIAEELNDLHSNVLGVYANSLLLAAARSIPGMVIWDDIQSVSVLASQPEVDPGRIGCLGLSCGGWRTVHLSATDTRIACSVPVGWMSTFLPIVIRRPRGSLGPRLVVHGLVQYADYPHVAALAAPRPMLSIQGERDKHFEPSAVRESWAIIREIYRRRGAEDRFHSTMYDAPHCFDIEMQEEAFAWLDRWLKEP